MIWYAPITSKADDLLRYASLAKRICPLFTNLESGNISVISVEGEWGSGKTSFINLILENLKEMPILIARFNPWNFSNPNELIKDIFYSVTDVLFEDKQENRREKKKKAKNIKKIIQYSYKLLKLSEIKMEPEFSIFGVFKFKLGEIFALESSLEKQTEEINSLLQSLGKKILIIVDDIDRLDKDETMLVFKLIRMLSELSNIHFLLAYDKSIVSKMLVFSKVSGEEYLKKIVQLSLPLPKPNPEYLFEILCDYLNEVIKDFEDEYWDEEEWNKLIHSSFNKFFTNIRDVKYYINCMKLDLEILDKLPKNTVDFIIIEVIRVFAPEVYTELANANKIFTAKVDFSDSETTEIRRARCKEIIDLASDIDRPAVEELILLLFPEVRKLFSDSRSADSLDFDSRKVSICREECFDRYFNSYTPLTDFSEKELVKHYSKKVNEATSL